MALPELSPRFIRFLFVGALNTAVGYGFFVLFLWIGAAPPLALALAFVCGVIFNFFSTGRLVFGNRDPRRIFGFCLVYLGLYGINLAALQGLQAAGLEAMIAQAILVGPMAVLSFLALKKVFRVHD